MWCQSSLWKSLATFRDHINVDLKEIINSINEVISTKSEFLVEMQGITKRFPGVLALDKVDFQLKPGEVHVLLGENGAGKSTLIKVLSGAHLADEGRIQIEGQAVDISSPHSMLEKGLRFIYQELNLVQEIDIARNMFFGDGTN